VLADVTRLPVKANAFSGVLCFGVMQALTDSAPAVQELARAVQPSGDVWMDALNAWCVLHLWERLRRKVLSMPIHVRYECPGRLRRKMKESGLVDVKLYWVPILPQRWQRLQPWLETPPIRWGFRWLPLAGALLSHSFLMHGRRHGSR